MKNIAIALKAEFLKLKHSTILFFIVCFYIFIPIMMGLLMILSQHPEIIAKMGLVGTKATLFATNNWHGYFDIINQMVAIIGLIGFGFVISWLFGREYMEHTITDILALPIPRSNLVIAKYIWALMLCTCLTFIMLLASFAVGKLIHIPEWSNEITVTFLKKFLITAGMTILVSMPVGFIASWSKGIIAPIGFVIVTLMLSQFIALAGLGPYFPWAIPGVNTVPAGTQGMELNYASYIIVFATAIIAVWGTIAWWKNVDHQL